MYPPHSVFHSPTFHFFSNSTVHLNILWHRWQKTISFARNINIFHLFFSFKWPLIIDLHAFFIDPWLHWAFRLTWLLCLHSCLSWNFLRSQQHWISSILPHTVFILSVWLLSVWFADRSYQVILFSVVNLSSSPFLSINFIRWQFRKVLK